jgi:hypothetical protein
MRLKFVKYPGIVIGSVIIVFVLIFTFLPDLFINGFLKDRITKAYHTAYPTDSLHLGTMHYNVWKNRLECDSIFLKKSDFTCRVASFSLSGIGLIKILRQSDFTPNTLANSEINALNIVLDFRKSRNELRLGILHISVPDSEIVIDSIKYYSLIDDELFFSKSEFRQTRFLFDIPQFQIMGLDCPALLQGISFIAKKVNIHDMSIDILVNMDKPYDKNSPNPQMPNEALSSIKKLVKVDSLKIINGKLKYSERFALKRNPGKILINKANVSISGFSNQRIRPDTTIINGEGIFMNSSKMKLFMAIPLTSKDFSLRYSGSLGVMDVTELNSFIEPGENQRIKSGILQSAAFNINVISGRTSGTLRAEYKDLTLAVINKETGSEKGIINRISSFYAKIFVIRGTNMPDDKGAMKIGETKYTRNPDDYFFQFIWFALRNGVADIVGFPRK